MISERKSTTVFYFDPASGEVEIKKVLDHVKGFYIGNNCGVRINLEKVCNIGSVIWLHMLYNEIIRFAVIQNLLDIIQPFMRKVGVYSIHDSDLFIQDHIGVVGHTVWNFVLTFKKVNLMVINTDVFDSICNLHSVHPPV